MKPVLRRDEPEQAPTSWWTKVPREDFQKQIEAETPRMIRSTLGRRKGRAISMTEIQR